MPTEKIEEIKKISKSAKAEAQPGIEEAGAERMAPNKEKFDTLVGKTEAVDLAEALPPENRRVDTKKVSLMDEVRSLDRSVSEVHKITPDKLVVQAQEMVAKIDEIKEKLGTPSLEIKGSVQNLLRSKLSHIDESLKIALQKAGVEYKPPEPVNDAKNPIDRFLGFLTDGQHQLNTLANDVNLMHLNRKEISPASMLAVQIKVGFIQQELEFFAALLNKTLESVKTVMNVQV